jgi:hypothetical protein
MEMEKRVRKSREITAPGGALYLHNSVLLIILKKSKIDLITSSELLVMGRGCPAGKFP